MTHNVVEVTELPETQLVVGKYNVFSKLERAPVAPPRRVVCAQEAGFGCPFLIQAATNPVASRVNVS